MERPRHKKSIEHTSRETTSSIIGSRTETKKMSSEVTLIELVATFTVESYSILNAMADMGFADRAYVCTSDGGRLRIERSKSRQAFLKIQDDQKSQNFVYAGRPKGGASTIQVGSPLEYVAVTDPDNPLTGGSALIRTTPITSIEVWKDYLRAIEELHENAPHTMGALLSTTARGTKRQVARDYRSINP